VAGCPKSRVGYAILAGRIFNDISRQIGGSVVLASSDRPTPPVNPPLSSLLLLSVEPYHRTMPFGMNQSKAELLRHLRMSEAIYSQMAVSSRYIESYVLKLKL
jgi:hypothetical protein